MAAPKRLVNRQRARVRVSSLLHWGDESLQRITAAETLGMIPTYEGPDEIIKMMAYGPTPRPILQPILLIGNFDSLSMPEGVELVRRYGGSAGHRIGTSFEVQSADLFQGGLPCWRSTATPSSPASTPTVPTNDAEEPSNSSQPLARWR